MTDFNKKLIEKLNYSSKKLDLLYKNSPLAFISWDNEGKIIDLNSAAEKLFGWKKDELLDKNFISTIIAEEDRDVWQNWKNEDLEKLPEDFHSRTLKNNGAIINCSWNNIVIKEESGVKEIVSIAQRINEDDSREREMLKLVKAINETDNWVVITDRNGVIEYANTTVKDVTGYSKEEIIGEKPSIFKSNKHDDQFYSRLWETIKSGEVFNDVLINKKKNGEYFYSEQTITPIEDKNGEIVNYISVGKDITQNEQLRRKLEYISNYDISYALPNRKAIRRKIEDLIEINSEQILAALVINVNRLKYLNDIYEDPEKDNSLINLVADLINNKIINNNFCAEIDDDYKLAYLGGNNFAVVIDNIDSPNKIYKIAEDLLNVFKETISYNNEPFMLNARIGISVYPDDCLNSNSLLSNAEIALINIDENDYAFFDQEMNQEIKKYNKLEARLDKAVKNDEFVVYYQPYYKGNENSLNGFEALIRWDNPERGIVSPGEFIGILENSQLIKEVGVLVVKKVVKSLRKWIDKGYKVVPVSINLSAKQIEDISHLKEIYKIINKSGVDNSLIKFEITESSAMDDVNHSLKVMNKMKSKGFSIAIDDFGTGYSSFSYLQKFPIDYLKIDISFIRNMTLSQDGKNIVESIINIAHLLDLETIAEGVEEEQELKILNKLNNDYVQGYYYYQPLPEAEIENLFN